MDVLIVGASVAGVAAADALRSLGHTGRVVLVDADPNLPYDKPPLSKQALQPGWDSQKALLRPAPYYQDKSIDLVLGRAAASLDADRKAVTLDDGTELTADAVVIATGVRARRLSESSMLPGVFSIRTLADSRALQQHLARRSKLAIVGGGFIGAEVASVAAELGVTVTIIDVLPLPFQHIFGPEVAAALARRHSAHGVTLVCGQGVDRLDGDGRVQRVVLTNGQAIEADTVLLGLGAEPCVEWLHGSGIELGNGVLCDEFGRTSTPGIYAAGDVAAWWSPTAQVHSRIEHWTTAKEQGAAVAHNITDGCKTAGSVPYFWSDQYGSRLQFLGTSSGYDQIEVVHGGLDTNEFVVLYGRAGILIGALGLAATRQLMRYRPLIDQRAPMTDLAQARAAS
ncbi:FAD-dependent oxidoreductase [Saccharopolyspora shandongensis]|uniref:NAD(P)/FAD-dependent oxidoreductase n=1 Tax=Saccharopolyspora shandongensis TaxID=418495 RepID=UPI0033CA9073